MTAPQGPSPASRAYAKLDFALERFAIDVTGRRCADLGCHVGGFTDCLLRRGAISVVSVDTGYGILDWRLRSDPRVEVRERTNALHAEPPPDRVDFVSIDLGWTPQRLALPAARRWISELGEVITLVKPHYELEGEAKSRLEAGRLDDEAAQEVLAALLPRMPRWGFDVLGHAESPIRGGKSGKGRAGAGNLEFLVHLRPVEPSGDPPASLRREPPNSTDATPPTRS
jgi:23S rRNA (cytidine1920-2'-O)/16S rRNA (cytidine1409-2'-O)-methyltransferase